MYSLKERQITFKSGVTDQICLFLAVLMLRNFKQEITNMYFI